MKIASPFQKANWLSVCLLTLVILFSYEHLAPAAVINQQPQSTNVLAGSNATFTVVAGGTAPLSYQWQFNETNLTDNGRISGAANATLTISNVVPDDAGGYRVVVSNSVSVVTSSVATLTVLWPPAVNTQPASQKGVVNGTATFSVAVAGSSPLFYQWQKDGVNLTDGGNVNGATNSTLSISGLFARDAGAYRVVVSNGAGTTTSAEASLWVVPLLAWGSNAYGQNDVPISATNLVAVAVGSTHTLALRADGTLVTWGDNYFGQLSIPVDATNIVAIAAGKPGYSLALRQDGTVLAWGFNVYGQTAVPAVATNLVAVFAHTVHSMGLRGDGTAVGWGYGYYGITSTPFEATNLVALSIASDFDLALREDGVVLGWGFNDFGGPNVPPDVTNAVAISAGWLHGIALRSSGTVVGWGNGSAGQTNSPPDATNVMAIEAGDNHNLALRADETILAWGDNSAGQLNIPAIANHVVAIRAGGNNSVALLDDPSAPILPYLGRQPCDQMAPAGKTVIFHALALGSLPVRYQWFRDGVLLPQCTNAWLALRNVQLDQSASYFVVVTNRYGAATSEVAALTVGIPPAISLPPTDQSVVLGQSAEFSVAATGTGPLSFQWQRDGTNLLNDLRVSGADSPELTLSAARSDDAASYRVIVSSAYGTATSAEVTLTVFIPATIVTNPLSQTVSATANASFSVLATGTPPLSYQ